MTPRKLNVMIATFPYGGNGATASEHPDCRKWYVRTVMEMKADPRIGEIRDFTESDTPITMTRNRAVTTARELGVDVLLMLDSDQAPDLHAGEGWFKPFWKTSFDFLCAHYDKGPCVIGAPYCGPPGGTENVYVFKWENFGWRGDETNFALQQYTRSDAYHQKGIQEVAALPTGLIMYDMRAFDLIEPSPLSKSAVLEKHKNGELSTEEALRSLREGFFAYEWKNGYADEKASTEDVQNTRDIGMCCQAKLGYNPIYCNWDSWIGHWKPWCVGKPRLITTEQISDSFKDAVLGERSAYKRTVQVDNTSVMERMKQAAHARDKALVREKLEKVHQEQLARLEKRGSTLTAAAEHMRRKHEEIAAIQRGEIAPTSKFYSAFAPTQATDAQHVATVGPPIFDFDGRSEEA